MVAICLVFKRIAMVLPSSKTDMWFKVLFLVQFLFAFISTLGVIIMDSEEYFQVENPVILAVATLISTSLFLLLGEIVSVAVFVKMIKLVCRHDSKLDLSIRASRASSQAKINYSLQKKMYLYLVGLILGDMISIALQIVPTLLANSPGVGLTYYTTSWFW